MKREPAGFRVTPLEPAHHDAWAPLWTRYLALLGYGGEEGPRDVWSRLTGGGLSGGLGAWEAERGLVGVLHYARQAHPWAAGGVWFIADMFTDERVRGRGIARALLEATFAQARAEGAAWVWGGVGVNNAPARSAFAELAQDVGQGLYRRML